MTGPKRKYTREERIWMRKPCFPFPATNEWDFKSVPDDQADLCLYYEYGRNAEWFKKRVFAWRQQNQLIMEAAVRLVSSLESAMKSHVVEGVPETVPPGEPIETCLVAGPAGLKEFLVARMESAWPDLLDTNSPQAFLYYFPAFPDLAWMDIAASVRRLSPVLFGFMRSSGQMIGNETVEAQRQLQEIAGHPLSEIQIVQAASSSLFDYVFRPPLVEAPSSEWASSWTSTNDRPFPASSWSLPSIGIGRIPGSYRYRKGGDQIWAEGFCHERVEFIVNWARTNTEIQAEFKKWLTTPGRRPHDELENWKMSKPHEHLKKLGALRILGMGISGYQAAHHCQLYDNPEQYLRAKRQAKQFLHMLFPRDNT